MRTSINRCHSSLAMCGLAVALVWAQPVLADGRDFRHRNDGVPGLPTEGQDGSMGFRSGMVAVANPYAAEAGARILEAGGNAVDAAVAIAYALNVVEPQSAGIGGGGFMLVHLADSGRGGGRFGGKTFAVDTRERAPAGARSSMFAGLNFTQASTSGVSVGVPGRCAAWPRRWTVGQAAAARVLKPAIRLADDRFAATARFVTSPNGARRPAGVGLPRNGRVLLPGRQTHSRRSDRHQLAAGRDAARIATMARTPSTAASRVRPPRWRSASAGGAPGTMTLADLKSYRQRCVNRWSGLSRLHHQGHELAVSGGLTLLQMLGMVERFPIGDAGAGYGFGSTVTRT